MSQLCDLAKPFAALADCPLCSASLGMTSVLFSNSLVSYKRVDFLNTASAFAFWCQLFSASSFLLKKQQCFSLFSFLDPKILAVRSSHALYVFSKFYFISCFYFLTLQNKTTQNDLMALSTQRCTSSMQGRQYIPVWFCTLLKPFISVSLPSQRWRGEPVRTMVRGWACPKAYSVTSLQNVLQGW